MEEAKNGNNKYDCMAKVIILGDSGVGKTNFITRFCENKFKQSYVATIGVDFKIKSVTVDDKRYKLQIWDTAGQERFKNITQTYYKGAAGIIVTFSIVDRTSFTNISRWMTQIENGAPQGVSRIIVGTKADLEAERQVSIEEGIAVAQKYGLQYVEVSSKDGKNIPEAINALVKEIHKNGNKNDEVITHKKIVVNKINSEEGRKSCSC